jgi:Fe-S cluster assembly protein SufD
MPEEAKAAGAIFMNLRDAIEKHGNIVNGKLGTLVKHDEHKLAALCAAAFDGGVFLYVPKGVKVKAPFVAEIAGNGSSALFASRTLVIAEDDSKFTYYEKRTSNESNENATAQSLHLATSEVFLGTGAHVEFVGMHALSPNSHEFTIKRAQTGKASDIGLFNGYFGAKMAYSQVDTMFRGEKSIGRNYVVFSSNGKEHCDVSANAIHEVPDTKSNMLSRGAVSDEATATYRGLINIQRKAHGTGSFLTGSALLLSEKARANSIPSLVIDTNDVQSKHGASVGHLDQEQVFYVMSRGLPRKEAERMLVEGFFEALVGTLAVEEIKAEMTKMIAGRLGL